MEEALERALGALREKDLAGAALALDSVRLEGAPSARARALHAQCVAALAPLMAEWKRAATSSGRGRAATDAYGGRR